MFRKTLIIETKPSSIINITYDINHIVGQSELREGLCHLFVKHTSCSLIISENADPDVLKDLSYFMERLVPDSSPYLHHAEGADDMPAHIRSVLTQTALSIPFESGSLEMGRWQAVYLWEHREQPYQRQVVVSLVG